MNKKIIKAILGGLGISIALAALFPSAFLTDDAKWTHHGNFGRVDIAFAGDVSDGQIEVQGKSLQVYKLRGLLDKRHNQGVVVQFPASYLKKSHQITLIPQGKGKKISFAMRFRGEWHRINEQVKPAWVRFENIRLNGNPIAQEKTVWHNKPFVYRTQNVEIGKSLTLNLDIQKPFSFTDIRWERLFGLFIACSLLISYSDVLRQLVNTLNKKDILQVIAKGYSDIDVVYRRSFWIIFGVLCFSFGFHAIQFMWGNHDWNMLITSSRPWGRYADGRYALHFLKNIFLGNGIYLPFAYDVVTFFFLALNAVLLCIYWKLKKGIVYFVLCGLILTAQPFTLCMMYFIHMIPEVFVLTALMISEKIAFEKSSLLKKSSLSVLSIVLINLSLAMYPVLLNTIAVAFVGRLLIKSFEWDGSWKQGRIYIVPYTVSALNIVLGILSYKAMLSFVFPPREDMYNVQMLPLNQLPERLLTLFEQSFRQLYEYNFPFISQGVLWVFLTFTILIALHICLIGNFKQTIVRLILLGGALFSTQAAMMVAKHFKICGRIELFGLVVFEVLVAALVFTKLKKYKNLTILAASGAIWVSIINDLDYLRVWKLGFDAEKMLWNRVLARMEIQKDFDIEKRYKVIQVGLPIPLRPRFYGKPWPSKPFHNGGGTPLTQSFDPSFGSFSSYAFYYRTDFRGENFRSDNPNDPKYKAQLKRLWEAGILDKAQVWPHENGLIVWKDVILFVTDAKALENFKKQLAKEFPRQPQSTP